MIAYRRLPLTVTNRLSGSLLLAHHLCYEKDDLRKSWAQKVRYYYFDCLYTYVVLDCASLHTKCLGTE